MNSSIETASDIDLLDKKQAILDKKLAILDKQSTLLNQRTQITGEFVKNNSKEIMNQNDVTVLPYNESFHYISDPRTALLPTAMVRIESQGKAYGPMRALIDSGAQLNLISYSLLAKCELVARPTVKTIVGIEGKTSELRKRVIVKVIPWYPSEAYMRDEFVVMPRDSNWQPILPTAELMPIENTVSIPLADPVYWKPGVAVLLLGIKFFASMIAEEIPRSIDGTVFMHTMYGMIVFGAQEQRLQDEIGSVKAVMECKDCRELDNLVKRLWEMDQIASFSARTIEEEQVEQNYIHTHARDETGRFIVTIPLKEEARDIGSSREIALRRFMFLERKLLGDAAIREQYVEFMREYERLGHMRKVTSEAKANEIVYHIPHHCVTKKFRVVFDASCKTNKGISLNDVQQLGEKLQSNLNEIVMRFRKYRVAMSADIKMMFRQVRIVPEQWNLQRIFWRESPRERLEEYWLTVITYGMTSSAHNAVRAVLQCARDAESVFPNAAKSIEKDLYMDDWVAGADDERDAINLAREVYIVLKSGGFELRKWKANSKELLDEMSTEHDPSMMLMDEETSILGLKWLTDSDQLTFVVKTIAIEGKLTKRKIVSCVAQLYDPNGFIAPVVILGKILIQQLWQLSLEWDEEVPREKAKEWAALWNKISALERLRIDRWIRTANDARIELHGFSDASTEAYGAVIYVRVEQANGENTSNLLT